MVCEGEKKFLNFNQRVGRNLTPGGKIFKYMLPAHYSHSELGDVAMSAIYQ